jgi:hypothetical protein
MNITGPSPKFTVYLYNFHRLVGGHHPTATPTLLGVRIRLGVAPAIHFKLKVARLLRSTKRATPSPIKKRANILGNLANSVVKCEFQWF